jgi:hypothetical protein
MSSVTPIIKNSRRPLVPLSALYGGFNTVVKITADKHNIDVAKAFWLTARQIAWEASSIDFSRDLQNEELRFKENRRQELLGIPIYKFLSRAKIQGDEFDCPLIVADQGKLMCVDPKIFDSLEIAKKAVLSWEKQAEPMPLQQVIMRSCHQHTP